MQNHWFSPQNTLKTRNSPQDKHLNSTQLCHCLWWNWEFSKIWLVSFQTNLHLFNIHLKFLISWGKFNNFSRIKLNFCSHAVSASTLASLSSFGSMNVIVNSRENVSAFFNSCVGFKNLFSDLSLRVFKFFTWTSTRQRFNFSSHSLVN